jgi:pimeloyl-ACP methyl ester carboxylesterase
MEKIIEPLAENHHCISIKIPGHCGMPSPGDFSNPTMETELEIIEQVVNLLTDEAVHLIGHSFGGVIALA